MSERRENFGVKVGCKGIKKRRGREALPGLVMES